MKKKIGNRIKEYRQKKGLTQEQFSEMLELSAHYYSSLERGNYNIKPDTLVKVMNILDCSADEIFCDVVKKSSAVKSSELSEKLKSLPVEEQNKILKQCYDETYELINENKSNMDLVVEYLLDKGEITEEEFIKNFNKNNEIVIDKNILE